MHLTEIEAARRQLEGLIVDTPTLSWEGPEKDRLLGKETAVFMKMELFQRGGSFKPRGALLAMQALEATALAKGVTAVSAGNHAIAVAYAAKVMGTHAKVVMPRTANPFRVARCQAWGAEVVLVDDVSLAFDEVQRIQRAEGRTFIHPFEGPLTALGTATVGLELGRSAPPLDAAIIPVGGGGLAAGMSSALKALHPETVIFGVEPIGADSMQRSFAAGSPQRIERVDTIADSLGAPFALPYSYSLCRQHLQAIVTVDDLALRRAMGMMLTEFKVAVEPAGAASLAALLGPLRERLRGKSVGLIACGSNIDPETFARWVVVEYKQ